MKKKCGECGAEFEATRNWSKYCSNGCRKKGSIRRVKKHRKKACSLKIKTLSEMKTKEPYKKNYEKMMVAFKKQQGKCKITLLSLSRETGLSRGTISKYLSIFRDLGVVDKTGNGFSLTEKHRLEPIKLHYDSLLQNTNMEHIYPGLEYMLFLPENLNAKEFSGSKLTVLFEEAFDRFLGSVRLILLDARLEKAKVVWGTKINSNTNIYSPLKLHLWIELLVSKIIDFSPVLRLGDIYDKKLDFKGKTQNSIRSLSQLIFRDICRLVWHHPKDIKRMNARMQTSFKDNIGDINSVWNEIHGIIEEKDFGIMISPYAFLKPSLDFLEGFERVVKKKEKDGLVKIRQNGRESKKFIHKTTMKETPSLFESQPVERGKYWFFNNFSKDTQEELRKLCINLGYTENMFYQVLGLFVFPLPILEKPQPIKKLTVNEKKLIEKRRAKFRQFRESKFVVADLPQQNDKGKSRDKGAK